MSDNRRIKFRPRFDNLDGRILLSVNPLVNPPIGPHPVTPTQTSTVTPDSKSTSTYSLTNGNLYEKTAGRSSLIASNVNSFEVTSTDAVVYLEQNGNLFEQPACGERPTPRSTGQLVPARIRQSSQVVDWFDSKLSNAGICNLTRTDFTRDDSITFSDMLGIFNEVLQSGAVTTAEVQDLQTVVSNATTLNMPGYVQNLASKVVNPSSTDVSYLDWYYARLGRRCPCSRGWSTSGSTGRCNPTRSLTADGSPPRTPTNTYTCGGATGYTLFGPNGPSYTDVAQGSAGDCWFLASLAETAARDPNIIQNMFINNGNGTWTVRFYVNGVAGLRDGERPVARGYRRSHLQWRLRLRRTAERDPLGRPGGKGVCRGEPVGPDHHLAAGGRFLRSPERWRSVMGLVGDHGVILRRCSTSRRA